MLSSLKVSVNSKNFVVSGDSGEKVKNGSIATGNLNCDSSSKQHTVNILELDCAFLWSVWGHRARILENEANKTKWNANVNYSEITAKKPDLETH